MALKHYPKWLVVRGISNTTRNGFTKNNSFQMKKQIQQITYFYNGVYSAIIVPQGKTKQELREQLREELRGVQIVQS